ncbi:unnamed protein product, partial [Mesorhabditis belari]|uniref:Sugar transporter SWEET n=1 Tax=Mesorhabditis belari TaxID=2138241 RepID=A0AAF3E9X8_9BILA
MLVEVLSVTALASTFGFFFCGAQICVQIRRKGGTEGIGAAPFLIAFLSCFFMLQYGILREDKVVILCNVVGLVLQGAYLLYYYSMTIHKRYLRRVFLIEALLIGAMEWMVHWSTMPDQGMTILSNSCMFLNIAAMGAPLVTLKEVIRSKSTASLPLPLCVASFAVSVQWLAYGILVNDPVIKYPNYIATLLALIQLSLFAIYGRSKTIIKKFQPIPSREKLNGYNI